MKKVLIITYYWPPAGGPGVQRVLKFVKYLPQFGWQPVILTVKNADYPLLDSSLQKDIPADCDVFYSRTIEPFLLYKKLYKKKESITFFELVKDSKSAKQPFTHWVRANFFIPDARIGWLFFAVKKALKIIRKENIDLIFTSSPPQTVNLIGKKLAKRTGLPWVADFRDPWTDIFYYQNLNRLKLTRRIDAFLEKSALEMAHHVTTVGDSLKGLLRSKISGDKFTVIQNGFDDPDFINPPPVKFDKFTIFWIGSMDSSYLAPGFFIALKNLFEEGLLNKNKIQLYFAGVIAPQIIEKVHEYGLKDIFVHDGYQPHSLAVSLMQKAHVLLFIIGNIKNNGLILQGKLFEYLASRNPILGYGPLGADAHKIIDQTGGGKMFDYNNVSDSKNFILKEYFRYESGETLIGPSKSNVINSFSRKNLTAKLAHVFNDVCNKEEI